MSLTVLMFERDGSIAGRYRKMHSPDVPRFMKKFYFTPGEAKICGAAASEAIGFTPIQSSIGKLGILVCRAVISGTRRRRV